MMIPRTAKLAMVCLTALSLRAAEFDSQMKLKAEAPGGAFIDGEPLRFQLVNRTPAPASYRVVNRKEETVTEGQWPAEAESLTLPTLPRGHYRLKTPDWECSFAVLQDPAKRPDMKDSYFAIDSHFCWSRSNNKSNGLSDKDGFDKIATMIRRIGVTVARDRLAWYVPWEKTNPAPGKYDFLHYPEAMESARSREITLMDTFSEYPPWALSDDPRRNAIPRGKRMADDLFVPYQYSREVAKTFQGKVKFWEFYNEQDHFSGGDTAWDFAANMKAAYLGIKSGCPDLTVLSGSFCLDNPGTFLKSALSSDLGEYFDILNYHTYMPRKNFPVLIEGIRNSMKSAGIPDRMPIWFSEIGTHVEGHAKVPGLRNGLMEHSFEQELAVAREIPKIYLAMQQLGVGRTFWYNMMPHNEQGGRKSWGLVRYDQTIKAQYTAFSIMTEQLGVAKLPGTMNLGEDVSAYLFQQPNHTMTLALWMERGKRSVKIPGSTDKAKAVDFLGATLALNNGTLELDENPVYINNLSGLVPHKKAADSGTPGALDSDCDKTVVMKVMFPLSTVLSHHRHMLDIPVDSMEITIDLFNFSNEEKRGTLSVTGAKLESSPKEITIPAMGKISVDAMLNVKSLTTEHKDIAFGGNFNGKPITKLTVPMVRNNPYPGYYREKALPNMMNPEAWSKNSSGKLEISRDTEEDAVKFTVEFPKGVDRWVYPACKLDLPEDARNGAIGFAVDLKPLRTGVDIHYFRLNLRGNKYSAGGGFFGNPGDCWQTHYYFFTGQDDLKKTDRIELGFNPNCDKYGWLIRNPRLLYPGKR